MDEKQFEEAYRKIKFEEDSSNCYSVAATRRKILLLNFYGSLLLKEDNHVTEFLLSQDLQNYSKIVDNKEPGNVNNYADYVLALLSNYQNDERKNWKSHLDEFNLEEHLENLPCSNEINCKFSNQFEAESLEKIREVFNAKEEAEPFDNFQTNEASSKDESNNLLENSGFETKTVQQSNMPNNVSVHSLFSKAEEEMERTSACNSSKRNNSLEKFAFERKSAKNYNLPSNDLIHLQCSRDNEESGKRNAFSAFPRNNSHGNSPEAKTPRQFTKKNNDWTHTAYSKAEDSERSNNFNAFRTARDELEIQNAKKFGKGGNGTNDKNYNYGTVKKSLGTRKGGVFSKFQPPLKPKDNNNDGQSSVGTMEVDEIVDERLKNIDPAMIELIRNEIMYSGSKITWNDIAGLHLAKSTIQEIVVWPMLRPDIFTGLRRPPKGILLFGPPGTGKTLIGKCIASQSNSTFFSISASSLTSKWVGDGEKMVRTLFAVAKVHQPSVVFIDEIDSLLSQRSDSEHECSRRIKTEFLVQLDGAGTGEEDRILIIGATNRPQELDEAARRRLVKRLYIPLPDEDARKQIVQNLISTERHSLTQSDIDRIATLTEGYSGADVKNLCQEASLGPIRSIAPSMIHSINPNDVRPLNSTDFDSALCRIKSSVSENDLDIYLAWDKQYGCGSSSVTRNA